MVNEMLKGLNLCFVYLDEFNIYHKYEKENLDHIIQVFAHSSDISLDLAVTETTSITMPTSLIQLHNYWKMMYPTYVQNHREPSKNIKTCLQKPTILVYPDPSKPYLFTNSSKCCWVATLFQYTSKSDNLDDLKCITFLSGKFLDIKCN